MVWARTKLLIWDYVFEPVKEIEINYTGKDPDKFYKKLKELIRSVFNIPDAYIQEKSYTWENAGERERFDVEWEINKILDVFSYINVEVALRGFVSNGEGKAGIKLKPRLITEYPQDTLWQQNLMYEMMRRFWHRMFYHHKRMEYLDMSKEILVSFESQIKAYGEKLRGN